MPAVTMKRSPHLAELENGLKGLKSSKTHASVLQKEILDSWKAGLIWEQGSGRGRLALRKTGKFESMYNLIEQHHRDLKLGYLTGMPSDRRKHAEEDCKFYYILTKMLREVDSSNSDDKEVGIAHVYDWFEENKHILHTGPRFGRGKQRNSSSAGSRRSSARRPPTGSKDIRSSRPATASSISKASLQNSRAGSSLGKVSGTTSRRQIPHTCKRRSSGEDEEHPPSRSQPSPEDCSEVSVAAEYYYQKYGGGHIEDIGLTRVTPNAVPDSQLSTGQLLTANVEDGQAESNQRLRPHSAPANEETYRPQAPTPDAAMKGRRSSGVGPPPPMETVLLPRRKPQPLPHVFNPLSKAFEATVDIPGSAAPSESSGTKFQLLSRGNDIYDEAGGGSVYKDPAGGVISLRMTHLQKWGDFQKRQNNGQEMLAKLQHVGRSGVPGSTRYAAHEHGVMTEEMTRDIIANYALLDEYRRLQEGIKPWAEDRFKLLEKDLEEFYASTEAHYPAKRDKYPSFKEKLVDKSQKSEVKASNSSLASVTRDSDVRLDTLVNMIDTVTDEMTIHKEKVAPNPMASFRQPTVIVEPGSRPQTAPPGARARPPSPDNRDTRSESHAYSRVAQGREQLLLRPATGSSGSTTDLQRIPAGALDLVDWRGKVTPDSARSKWSQNFGGHSYIQKMARPRSSLRTGTASSHNAPSSRRPKTSNTPQPVEDRYLWTPESYTADNKRPAVAASHTTTEVDGEVVSSLLTTTKFNSAKMRIRPEMAEDDEYEDGFDLRDFERQLSRGHDGASQQKAYLTFCSSLGGKAHQHQNVSPDEKSSSGNRQLNQDKSSQDPIQNNRANGAEIPTESRNFLEEVQRLINNSTATDTENTNGPEISAEMEQIHENQADETQQDSARKGPSKRPSFLIDGQIVGPGGDRVAPVNKDAEVGFGLNAEEAEIMNMDVDSYIRNHSPTRRSTQAAGSDKKFGQTYKQRIFQHSFPHQRPDTAPTVDGGVAVEGSPQAELSIEGQSTRRRFAKPPVEETGKANRSARTACMGRAASAALPRSRPKRKVQPQAELLARAPIDPPRTAPSIPTPWSQFGTRSPRPPTVPSDTGQQTGHPVYMAELESHSHKTKTPKEYVHRATTLRKPDIEPLDRVPRLPPPSVMTEEEQHLVQPLKVFRMKHEDGTPITISCEPVKRKHHNTDKNGQHTSDTGRDEACAACLQEQQENPRNKQVIEEFAGQKLLDMGRPISQYLPACDPLEVAAATRRLKEAQAAVDIQRIFRGYIARTNYKYLLREERQQREDKRKAAIEIQRHLRGHLSRKHAIYNREPNRETLAWAKEYKQHLKVKERERQVKALETAERNARKKAEADAKISIIGPHVEVYAPFHPKKTGPDRALLNRAATIIQRDVRRWLIKLRMEKLKRKAKYHANSWTKFMTNYQELLRRIQLRAGVDKPQTPFDFNDISQFMDLKKRYESVFEKRAFSGEMEIEELPAYFHECDLYPAKSEIEEAMSSVFRGQPAKRTRGLYRQEVLEVTFQIYPPRGAGLVDGRRSTWLNPIVDGEEAIKLSGTDNVEPTDFATCWKLVSSTARNRREEAARLVQLAQEEEEQRMLGARRQAELKTQGKSVEKEASTARAAPTVQPAVPPEPPKETASEMPTAEVETTQEPDSTACVSEALIEETPPVTKEMSAETHMQEPMEDKTFLEKKLAKIEKEAPEWNPKFSDQPADSPPRKSDNLEPISELAEKE